MFGLFIISSFFNKLLMSPVVRLTFKKERLEGDFRFKHVYVRTNAESLAFSGPKSEAVEHGDLDAQLLALCRQALFFYTFVVAFSALLRALTKSQIFNGLSQIFRVLEFVIFLVCFVEKSPCEFFDDL